MAGTAVPRGALTPGRVINVCGGPAVTLTAVLDTLRDIAGKPLRITHTGEKAGDVFQTGGSSGAARDALGWSPRIDLASGCVPSGKPRRTSCGRDHRRQGDSCLS